MPGKRKGEPVSWEASGDTRSIQEKPLRQTAKRCSLAEMEVQKEVVIEPTSSCSFKGEGHTEKIVHWVLNSEQRNKKPDLSFTSDRRHPRHIIKNKDLLHGPGVFCQVDRSKGEHRLYCRIKVLEILDDSNWPMQCSNFRAFGKKNLRKFLMENLSRIPGKHFRCRQFLWWPHGSFGRTIWEAVWNENEVITRSVVSITSNRPLTNTFYCRRFKDQET